MSDLQKIFMIVFPAFMGVAPYVIIGICMALSNRKQRKRREEENKHIIVIGLHTDDK